VVVTVRRIVVDRVLFVVEDLDASRRLYTAALAPLGYTESLRAGGPRASGYAEAARLALGPLVELVEGRGRASA
jgi:hypothetical protein